MLLWNLNHLMLSLSMFRNRLTATVHGSFQRKCTTECTLLFMTCLCAANEGIFDVDTLRIQLEWRVQNFWEHQQDSPETPLCGMWVGKKQKSQHKKEGGFSWFCFRIHIDWAGYRDRGEDAMEDGSQSTRLSCRVLFYMLLYGFGCTGDCTQLRSYINRTWLTEWLLASRTRLLFFLSFVPAVSSTPPRIPCNPWSWSQSLSPSFAFLFFSARLLCYFDSL